MKRIVFLVVAFIVSVSIARSSPPSEFSQHTAGGFARGVGGSPQEAPCLAKQQLTCANLRPAFQTSAAKVDSQGSAPRNQESEVAILDEPLGSKCGLFRVFFGRAPPLDHLR
jgi:hypothetical protein